MAGFDPYISRDEHIANRITIRKLGVDEMPIGWDLIMLNHSLEHMARPVHVLESCVVR